MSEREKLNRLEELKTKLFSKSYQTKIEHRDNFTILDNKDIPIKDSWDSGENAMMHSGDSMYFSNKKDYMFRNLFIFSIVFFIITLCYASYVFFIGGNTVSNDNIDISVVGNSFTGGGEELALVVGISNRNNLPLLLADLVVEYPKSSAPSTNVDASQMETSRISLGTIPPGALRSENVKIVLFGEQGVVRPVKFSVEYRVEGSNSIFVKSKDFAVTINSTPLNIVLDAPDSITPNQDITLNIKTTLNSSRPASNILLQVDYPAGFVFSSSSLPASNANNVWILGDLAPGSEKDISITGKMVDVFDGEEKSFRISSGSQSSTDKFKISEVFNSLSHVVYIKKPFIETKLSVNGVSNKDYAVDSKTPISGSIQWTNNLDTKVNDLAITARITGNVLNKKSIDSSNGFYDSKNDLIIWDKNFSSNFAEVNPGASGTVNFSFSTLPLISSNNLVANPSVNIEVSISGKQMLDGYETKDLTNSDSATVKIISDFAFTGKVLHSVGFIVNSGPIPPKVENTTSYTINWNLSNTVNNLSRGFVRSTLPPFVNFVGPVYPETEDLSYNPSTREVVWNVGSIPKSAGVSKPTRSVSFQVSISPSLSQVGTPVNLINNAVLTAHDDFANVDVKASVPVLNTNINITNEPTFPQNGGAVVE